MTGLCNFTGRTHQVFLGEQLTRTHAELTADNLFIKAVVTVDDDAVDTSLRTFDDTHLESNRVTLHLRFDWNELEEQVTVIHIEVGNGIVVFHRTLVQQSLVVNVAGLHAENGIEVSR